MKRLDPKLTATFLRTHVEHFSFVTGLLTGGSVPVNVLLNANVFEGVRVTNPVWPPAMVEAPYHNVLLGGLGQCRDLLPFIAGTYDARTLVECVAGGKPIEDFTPPTEFETETWEATEEDHHTWQLKRRTKYQGVKWLDAAHTCEPDGDSMCAGVATFTCELLDSMPVSDGEIIHVPEKERYPRFELRRILQRNLPDPKHPASYLG